MTSDDCIAIKTDVILVLVHRRVPLPSVPPSFHRKSNNATQAGPPSDYGDRHKSGGRFFSEGHGFLLDPNMITSGHLTGCPVPR